MATLALPLRNDVPYFDFFVELEGVTYGFAFRWNHRAKAWFVDLKDADDQPIVSGARVVVDFPLFIRSADPRRPPGLFIVTDTTGKRIDPGEHDLGGRVMVLYVESTGA